MQEIKTVRSRPFFVYFFFRFCLFQQRILGGLVMGGERGTSFDLKKYEEEVGGR